MYPKYSERKICNLILHLYNLRNSEIKNIEKKSMIKSDFVILEIIY